MVHEIEIRSPQNPRIKRAVRLRQRRGRDRLQRTLIEGTRELLRALAAGVEVEELFVLDDPAAAMRPEGEPSAGERAAGERGDAHAALRGALPSSATLIRCPRRVFEKIAVREVGAEAVGVARTPRRTLEQLPLPQPPLSQPPLIAVLEALEKPGNLGAILRSADGAGVDAVLVVDSICDVFSPNCIRASLGAVFTVPLWQGPGDEARRWLLQQQIHVFAARVEAARDVWQADLTGPVALVLGSEAEGVSAAWRSCEGVRLPMARSVDSLNVSAAAAAMFYEARRQRSC